MAKASIRTFRQPKPEIRQPALHPGTRTQPSINTRALRLMIALVTVQPETIDRLLDEGTLSRTGKDPCHAVTGNDLMGINPQRQ